MEEDCPVCKDDCGPKVVENSRRKAAGTAHELAKKKANEGIDGMDWEEVYALFFMKIYRHEYKRNWHLERELELEASLKRHEDSKYICDYHCENYEWMGDGTHDKCMQKLRKKYAESKWPNSLKY